MKPFARVIPLEHKAVEDDHFERHVSNYQSNEQWSRQASHEGFSSSFSSENQRGRLPEFTAAHKSSVLLVWGVLA